MNKKNSLLASLAIILIGIVVLTIQATKQPRDNVIIETAPTQATLDLASGKNITPGNLYLTPGKYTLNASMPGFANSKQLFIVPENGAVKLIVLLSPNSSDGYNYLQNHPDQQLLREKIGGSNYISASEAVQHNYPIIKLLPHNGLGFSINYGQSAAHPNDPSITALYVNYQDPAAKARALNWIKYNGYNTQDYEIIYQVQDASN